MATTDLTVTGFDANSGWVGTATNMAASNDTRVTGGVVGDTFDAAITNPGGTFGVSNSVQFFVEARTQGTVVRDKQIVIELRNAGGTLLTSYTTGILTGTDAVYNGTVDTTAAVVDANEATVDGWYLSVSLIEGGGMPDSATVEIDHLYLRVDFDPPPQGVTDAFIASGETFFGETIDTISFVTDDFIASTTTFPGETVVFPVDDAFIASGEIVYAESAALFNGVADAFIPSTTSFSGETAVLAETTRVIMIS